MNKSSESQELHGRRWMLQRLVKAAVVTTFGPAALLAACDDLATPNQTTVTTQPLITPTVTSEVTPQSKKEVLDPSKFEYFPGITPTTFEYYEYGGLFVGVKSLDKTTPDGGKNAEELHMRLGTSTVDKRNRDYSTLDEDTLREIKNFLAYSTMPILFNADMPTFIDLKFGDHPEIPNYNKVGQVITARHSDNLHGFSRMISINVDSLKKANNIANFIDTLQYEDFITDIMLSTLIYLQDFDYSNSKQTSRFSKILAEINDPDFTKMMTNFPFNYSDGVVLARVAAQIYLKKDISSIIKSEFGVQNLSYENKAKIMAFVDAVILQGKRNTPIGEKGEPLFEFYLDNLPLVKPTQADQKDSLEKIKLFYDYSHQYYLDKINNTPERRVKQQRDKEMADFQKYQDALARQGILINNTELLKHFGYDSLPIYFPDEKKAADIQHVFEHAIANGIIKPGVLFIFSNSSAYNIYETDSIIPKTNYKYLGVIELHNIFVKIDVNQWALLTTLAHEFSHTESMDPNGEYLLKKEYLDFLLGSKIEFGEESFGHGKTLYPKIIREKAWFKNGKPISQEDRTMEAWYSGTNILEFIAELGTFYLFGKEGFKQVYSQYFDEQTVNYLYEGIKRLRYGGKEFPNSKVLLNKINPAPLPVLR